MTLVDFHSILFLAVILVFFVVCIIPAELTLSELLFRALLLIGIVLVFTLQTTVFSRFPIFGVRLELVPPLILFIALTTNFSMTVASCLFASLLYDTYASGRLGLSLLPYVIGGGVFSAIRPMLYRNSWLTRFVSGWTICMVILFGQWVAYRATGTADIPFWEVIRTIMKL
jgi:hypothetical protein